MRRARRPEARLGAAAALAIVALAAGSVRPLHAQLSQEEALRLAFPGADTVERRTAYLDDGQLARAAALAGPGVEVESGVVTYYLAVKDGGAMGVAYFDAHLVRTLPEVLMVVVTPRGTVARVETVSFREPPEYEAPEGWLGLMTGRALDEDLSLKREIPNLTGATLTARAAVGAVRRVLAVHAVVRPFGTPAGGGGTPAPGPRGRLP